MNSNHLKARGISTFISIGTVYSLSKRTDLFMVAIGQRAGGDAHNAQIYSMATSLSRNQLALTTGMRLKFRFNRKHEKMNDSRITALRSDTPFMETCTFLDHAALAPISRSVQQAMIRLTELHITTLCTSDLVAKNEYARGRSLAAKLVGAKEGYVAYVQNTSFGMSMIATGIDATHGDNIVVPAMEFPSNFLPWLQLEEQGVEVRRVAADNGRITVDSLRDVVDSRTKVVALSHVQYYNGYRVDLTPIAELCHSHDALLVVDGTQSIGALTLDIEAVGVDVLVVASHKWMLGPLGTGFAAFSSKALERIRPRFVGWLSVNEPFAFNRTMDFLDTAQRFEPGSENSVGIFGLTQRLASIHEIGSVEIETRVLSLIDYLVERSKSAGLSIVNPLEENERSGIVLLKNERSDSEIVHKRLLADGIRTSFRSGAIRVSPHYHNTFDEMDVVVAAMIEQ